MERQRQKIVPLAYGRVLEIGTGTGLNFRYYDKERVESVIGVDPAQEMHALALERATHAGIKTEIFPSSATQIPLAANTFDTVLSTYSLCSIPQPEVALQEVLRVLKPNG